MADNDQSLYDLRYNQVTQKVEGAGGTPTWNELTITNGGGGSGITTLTGDVSAGPGSGSQAATISAATVTGKLLTGYVSGAGTVAASDTILQGINKLNGNDALKLPLAGGTMTGPLVITPSSDSTAVVAVNKTGGSVRTFTVDTTNSRVSAGLAQADFDFGVVKSGGIGDQVISATRQLGGNASASTQTLNDLNYGMVVLAAGSTHSNTDIRNKGCMYSPSSGMRFCSVDTGSPIDFSFGTLANNNVALSLSGGITNSSLALYGTGVPVLSINSDVSATLAFRDHDSVNDSATLTANFDDGLAIGTADGGWTFTPEGLLNLNSLTTTQRNATTPVAGSIVYNSSTNKLNFYNGIAWEAVTSV